MAAHKKTDPRPTHKACCVCQEVKPFTDQFFVRNTGARFRLLSKCKSCRNAELKEGRARNNPDRHSPYKVCAHCKSRLHKDQFRQKGGKSLKGTMYIYLSYICIPCETKKNLAATRNWRSNLTESAVKMYTQKHKEWAHKVGYYKAAAQQLKDYYIRRVITKSLGIPAREVTQDMMDLKKKLLKLSRHVKNKKDSDKDPNSKGCRSN